MTGFTYLGALLVAIGCMALIDARWRLAFWRAPAAAAAAFMCERTRKRFSAQFCGTINILAVLRLRYTAVAFLGRFPSRCDGG